MIRVGMGDKDRIEMDAIEWCKIGQAISRVDTHSGINEDVSSS